MVTGYFLARRDVSWEFFVLVVAVAADTTKWFHSSVYSLTHSLVVRNGG